MADFQVYTGDSGGGKGRRSRRRGEEEQEERGGARGGERRRKERNEEKNTLSSIFFISSSFEESEADLSRPAGTATFSSTGGRQEAKTEGWREMAGQERPRRR